MRMGEENMANIQHLFHAEITDAGARIDQNVLINEQSRGPQVYAYTTTTS